MKANRLSRAFIAAAVGGALLAGCAPERRVVPTPAPARTPRPAPLPPPPPPPADWRDVAITPGTWSYRPESGGSSASFGPAGASPLLTLRCERPAGRVTLARAGAAESTVPLTVTTTTGARAFSATPQAGAVPQLALALAPRDPLLDAMAFSRGRFMVEAPGLPTLYLPTWPEVARVVEDCR